MLIVDKASRRILELHFTPYTSDNKAPKRDKHDSNPRFPGSSLSGGSGVVMVEESSRTCPICQRQLFSRHNRDRHYEAVHLKIKKFQCTECTSRFSGRSELDRHINIVHLKKLPFHCELCDYKCGYRKLLKDHILKYHTV